MLSLRHRLIYNSLLFIIASNIATLILLFVHQFVNLLLIAIWLWGGYLIRLLSILLHLLMIFDILFLFHLSCRLHKLFLRSFHGLLLESEIFLRLNLCLLCLLLLFKTDFFLLLGFLSLLLFSFFLVCFFLHLFEKLGLIIKINKRLHECIFFGELLDWGGSWNLSLLVLLMRLVLSVS